MKFTLAHSAKVLRWWLFGDNVLCLFLVGRSLAPFLYFFTFFFSRHLAFKCPNVFVVLIIVVVFYGLLNNTRLLFFFCSKWSINEAFSPYIIWIHHLRYYSNLRLPKKRRRKLSFFFSSQYKIVVVFKPKSLVIII